MAEQSENINNELLQTPEQETQETKLEKSKSAEEIAALILKQQQEKQQKNNENLIVSNFVSFFEPLVKNLESNADSLRLSQIELTNQIKILLAG
jgi:hypothetical protein